MKLRYVKLTNNKTPVEKLSAGGHPLEEVQDSDNIGVLIPEPMVVFDFDTPSDSEIIQKIVKDLDIHCLMMKTTRGVHVWFKSSSPMKNVTKCRSAIGIYYDIRSYGKKCYAVVKKNGEWREWIRQCPGDEIDEVPAWLLPLSYGKNSFKGMKDGDGRNQTLYEYILIMQSKHFSHDDIKATIRIINEYVFGEPLSDSEIETICRDESFKSDEEIEQNDTQMYFDEEGKFKHELFAKALVKELHIICLNGLFYTYADGVYQDYLTTGTIVDRKMIEKFPAIKRNQRAEVWDYIRILSAIDPDAINVDEFNLTVKNTRIDLRTGNLLPFDSSSISFSQLPVIYNPTAYCADLDKCLNKVFCGNRQVIDLFEEMVGYCLLKNCKFRKGFIFYGGGSNGKSTVLNLLKKFFGESNTATVEMEKLSDRFKTAELENKLVNIGDDINKKDITDTGTLKKLFTGESVTVERKGQDPFTLRSYAKLIFSCNEIPRIADKSHGMYSRLTFIPFNATFSSDDEDFDPFIEDKITTEESLSYLLNIALRGLRRLLSNNHFTDCAVVNEALEEYKVDNSTVLTWVKDEGITLPMLTAGTTDRLFSDFKDWCSRSDIRFGASIRTFHRELEEKFNLERRRSRCTQDDKGNTSGFSWRFVTKL